MMHHLRKKAGINSFRHLREAKGMELSEIKEVIKSENEHDFSDEEIEEVAEAVYELEPDTAEDNSGDEEIEEVAEAEKPRDIPVFKNTKAETTDSGDDKDAEIARLKAELASKKEEEEERAQIQEEYNITKYPSNMPDSFKNPKENANGYIICDHFDGKVETNEDGQDMFKPERKAIRKQIKVLPDNFHRMNVKCNEGKPELYIPVKEKKKKAQ